MKDSNTTDWRYHAASQGIAIGTLDLQPFQQHQQQLPLLQAFPPLPKWASDEAKNLWPLAHQGDADAQNKLGEWFEQDKPVRSGNKKKAAEWYKRAADQGHADAQYNLGCCYQDGIGVAQKSPKDAKEWYQKAAEQGHAEAQYRLAQFWEYGWGGYNNGERKDLGMAVQWYEKAAKQGHDEAQYRLVRYYEKTDNKPQTAKWYQKIVEHGAAKTQYGLAHYYRCANKMPQAIECFEKAAEKNHDDAMRALFSIYVEGRGVQKDVVKALGWQQKMYPMHPGLRKMAWEMQSRPLVENANKGDAQAQHDLGRCYESGIGVKQDRQTAMEWFQKAAANGYVLQEVQITPPAPAAAEKRPAAAEPEVQSAKRNGFAEKEAGSKRYRASSDTEEEFPGSFSVRVSPIRERGEAGQGSPRR